MFVVVYVTVPSEEVGKNIARGILEERLAACVNVVKGLTSIYWWKDAIQEEPECLLIIKTKLALFEKLEAKVRQLHPYETPEIIAAPIMAGSRAYLQWLGSETQPTEEDLDFRGVRF